MLKNQRDAAKYVGIGVKRFRLICREGNGPRQWNPDGGRVMYATSVLDEWLHERDDRTERRAS